MVGVRDADSGGSGPFSAQASWIWWPDEKEGVANRYFRREFRLASLPESAWLRITCDNGYTVFVNGREVGSGNAWEHIQEYDVASLLKPGANAIAVDARNAGGEGALIAELTLRDGKLATSDCPCSRCDRRTVALLAAGGRRLARDDV